MTDAELACLFRNALPNTLDTTVMSFSDAGADGAVDTFVITGDIAAMWLRDSTNQVLPYLRYAREDARLRRMLGGLVRRQTRQVAADPWANAHTAQSWDISPHATDATSAPAFAGTRAPAMKPGIYERKYELDSLLAFLKLSRAYFAATDDASPFDATWLKAVASVASVIRAQQRPTALPSDYQFSRMTSDASDTLILGVGPPARRTGMSRPAFRPSDEACVLPFLIPANAMAVVELNYAASMLSRHRTL